MTTIREPAVAGLFYPADPATLKAEVEGFLAAARSDLPAPKAIIAPHAGYVYSGTIAASAFARLANGRDAIHRVVLLGPSHRVPFYGLAVSGASALRTPLGLLPVDTNAVALLTKLPHVKLLDEAHRLEHSLEVQLPFLQCTLKHFTVIPIVVGECSAADVSAVIDSLWDGAETVFVISSDLSHYQDYATAQRMDGATSAAIERLDGKAISYDQACGRNPILGLLQSAHAHGLNAKTIDLRNSGDTAGPRDQVVGYGAYVFQ